MSSIPIAQCAHSDNGKECPNNRMPGFNFCIDHSSKEELVKSMEQYKRWLNKSCQDLGDLKKEYEAKLKNTEAKLKLEIWKKDKENIIKPLSEFCYGKNSQYYCLDPKYYITIDGTTYTYYREKKPLNEPKKGDALREMANRAGPLPSSVLAIPSSYAHTLPHPGNGKAHTTLSSTMIKPLLPTVVCVLVCLAYVAAWIWRIFQ